MSDHTRLLTAYLAVADALSEAEILPLSLRAVGSEAVFDWAVTEWRGLVLGARRYEWDLAVAVASDGEGTTPVSRWLGISFVLQGPPPEVTGYAPLLIPPLVLTGWRARQFPLDTTPATWVGRQFLPGWVLTLTILVPILDVEDIPLVGDILVDARVPPGGAMPPIEPPTRDPATDPSKRVHTRTPTEKDKPEWNKDWKGFSDPQ